MSYIDGFVLAVPTANREAYVKMAQVAADLLKEFGATRIVEAWGDDVPRGKQTDFHMAVKAEQDETIVFSWIEWPSKELRDEGQKKMMNDPRMAEAGKNMPFDGKRMIWAGFTPLLDQ